MKKTLKSVLAALLSALMLLSCSFVAQAEKIPTLSGQTSRTVKQLYNGVTQTHITTSTSSKYGFQNINVVEFNPAQEDLYFDVVSAGTYSVEKKAVSTIAKNFTNANNGKTALAAVNGDLWMVTSVHSRTSANSNGPQVVTNALPLPRGFDVYNGEIITSPYMTQESPYQGDFWSFGMTKDNTAVLGCPKMSISVTSPAGTVAADGLNRLPANNAFVVYTDKGCQNNYALSDAYEVVIDCGYDYKVTHGATITGTVSGIYSSTTASNPTMQANRIILTARGSALSKLAGITVGASVSVSFSVYEKFGRNTSDWQNINNAVGGHSAFVVDGMKNRISLEANYPSTILGITNSGKVVMMTADGRQASTYAKGIASNMYWDLADDFDLNSAFIVDGGGSSELVTADPSNYANITVQNHPSDGSERPVINAVVLSFSNTKHASIATDVKTPSKDIDLTELYFGTDEGYAQIVDVSETSIEKTVLGAQLTAHDLYANGPTAIISYGLPNTTSANSASALAGTTYSNVSADTYKYMVMTMFLQSTVSSQLQVVYGSSGALKVADNSSYQYNMPAKNQWVSSVIDMSSVAAWKGKINLVSLGYLVTQADWGYSVKEGDMIYLNSIKLVKTLAEANALAANPAPQPIMQVTLDPCGGTVEKTMRYSAYGKKTGELPTPVRSGFVFDGWYTAAEGGTKVESSTTVTSPVYYTLYAHWSLPSGTTYQVSYNANGGSGEPTSQSKVMGTDLTLSSTTPTRADCTFIGWADNAAGEGALYPSAGKYTFDKAITLYAVWRPNSQNVAYTTTASWLNMRSAPSADAESLTSIPQGSGLVITATSERWGYTSYNGYKGWVSMNYCEAASQTEYTVSFNANDGSAAPAAETKQANTPYLMPSAQPTWGSYEFLGWAKSPVAAEPDFYPGTMYNENSDVTLYAVWETGLTKYTITYDANGGSGAPPAQNKYQGLAKTITTDVPTRDGFSFLGWAISSRATVPTYTSGSSFNGNADVTLYAVWELIPIPVEVYADGILCGIDSALEDFEWGNVSVITVPSGVDISTYNVVMPANGEIIVNTGAAYDTAKITGASGAIISDANTGAVYGWRSSSSSWITRNPAASVATVDCVYEGTQALINSTGAIQGNIVSKKITKVGVIFIPKSALSTSSGGLGDLNGDGDRTNADLTPFYLSSQFAVCGSMSVSIGMSGMSYYSATLLASNPSMTIVCGWYVEYQVGNAENVTVYFPSSTASNIKPSDFA